MRLVRFGGYVFPAQMEYGDNFGELKPSVERLPGMSGGWRSGGLEPSRKDVGGVRAIFWLLGTSPADLQAKLDTLHRMQSAGVQRLVMRAWGDPNDTGLRWVDAELIKIDAPQRAEMHPSINQWVELIFQCPDPYWNQLGTESWRWGDGTLWGGGAVWGGGAPVYALPALQSDFIEQVAGNAATYPRIVLSLPAGAAASGFTLQRRNDSGGVLDEISFSDALTAGDVLIVNARDMSVKLNGANAFTTAFDFARANFFRLEPGANRLRITFDSVTGAPELRLRYYTRW